MLNSSQQIITQMTAKMSDYQSCEKRLIKQLVIKS